MEGDIAGCNTPNFGFSEGSCVPSNFFHPTRESLRFFSPGSHILIHPAPPGGGANLRFQQGMLRTESFAYARIALITLARFSVPVNF